MIRRFKEYIDRQHLFAQGEKVLAAVSGGADSSVLCHLLHSAGFSFDIAHCNFNLRPGDCDRDEQFVRQMAERYGVECHVARFETRNYATANHLSIEEAARDLRYGYFKKLLAEHGYAVVATAHHSDDSAETFFINLMRGTGIAGLRGIPPRTGNVVRPMLCFSRTDILSYAGQNGIDFVTDSTNSSLDYRRNRVRHQLLPLLREMAPGFDATLARTIANLADTELVYNESIENLRNRIVRHTAEADILPISELTGLNPRRTLMFELLKPYGFNSATAAEIDATLDGQPGSVFLSPTHRLVRDRDALVVESLGTANHEQTFAATVVDAAEVTPEMLRNSHLTAYFDADRVKMPLSMRPWRDGDRFTPFGMHGSRLVSDFLTGLKLNRFQKERVRLLCDADGNILWVMGLRTANQPRVTEDTKKVLKIKFQPKVPTPKD